MIPLSCKPSEEICPICGRFKIAYQTSQTPTIVTVSCPLCGHYNFSQRLISTLAETKPNHILSGITRNYWESTKSELLISCDTFSSLDAFITKSPITVPRKADIPAKGDLILKLLRRRSIYPGIILKLSGTTDYSVGFCQSYEELHFCAKYLNDMGFLEQTNPSEGADLFYRITPSGWAYLSGIGVEAKDQGFIAMAFKPELKPVSDSGICPGIENAGYKPLRIDSKNHNNRIDDEIVAEIRKSRFVVTDLTGMNAGAYFEAGFGLGLGKPVIWTCNNREIEDGKVHFDTRQYSIVSWEPDKLDDFAKRLTQRIEATIGHGRYVPA